VGTDPSGSETLRVGGAIRIENGAGANAIIFSNLGVQAGKYGASGGELVFSGLAAGGVMMRMTASALRPEAAGGLGLGTAALPWDSIRVGTAATRGFFYVGSEVNIGAETAHNVTIVRSAAGIATFTAAAFNPAAAGGLSLGTLSLPWGDLFLGTARPITLLASGGSITIKGDSGGWATSYGFLGSAGTAKGGFGALGGADALTYLYIGDAFNSTVNMRWDGAAFTPGSAGALTLGTGSLPWGQLFVRGDSESIRLARTIAGGSPYIAWYNQAGGRLGFLQHDSAAGFILDAETATAISFYTNATARWNINSGGSLLANSDNSVDIGASGATRPRNIHVGTSIIAAAGSASTPAYRFTTTANTGFFESGTDQIGVTVNQTERWRWTSSGHLICPTDNTYDIGAAGATRPRDVYIAGNLTVGGTSTLAGIVKVLYQNQGLSSNSTSDVSLASYSLPASTLASNGQSIRITLCYRAVVAAGQLNIKFGASVVCNIAPAAGVSGTVIINIIRSGAATQFSHAMCLGSSLVIGDDTNLTLTPSETLSGAVTIDFRGNTAAGGTISYDIVKIEFLST